MSNAKSAPILNSYEKIAKKVSTLVCSALFHKTVIFMIILSALTLGLETNQSLMAEFGEQLKLLDTFLISFFVFEIILKIIANGKSPHNYFKDGWNVLDFLIVLGCFVPTGSNAMAIFRLVRVLRIFRLVTALPKLQIIISALIKSIPSMGYVVALLALHFYMYGVLGTFLFAKNDPIHFGSLGKSFLTLFQVLTLEGWVDIMRIQIYGCASFGYEGFQSSCILNYPQPVAGVLYFISFIVLGTMFILNLLIGAVINGMSESQKEATIKNIDTAEAISQLTQEVKSLKDRLEARAQERK
jgi:voltage-gated sodium channel